MILLHILIHFVATSPATKDALASQAQRAVARALLLHEPRIVWCRVESHGIWRISREPGGPEVPHSATMTARGASWAYYYPMPTRPHDMANWLGFHADQILLLATGRETTTAAERWREFRRCGEEEFAAALASWRKQAGG